MEKVDKNNIYHVFSEAYINQINTQIPKETPQKKNIKKNKKKKQVKSSNYNHYSSGRYYTNEDDSTDFYYGDEENEYYDDDEMFKYKYGYDRIEAYYEELDEEIDEYLESTWYDRDDFCDEHGDFDYDIYDEFVEEQRYNEYNDMCRYY